MILLIGVAFLTLLERKVLGYVQYRKGPNKVRFIGVLQPFRDAVKLLFKEVFYIFKSNYIIFYITPMLRFIIIIIIWLVLPYITNLYYLNYSILLMIIFMSIGGYLIIFIGWSSNSIYSIIGSIRSVSQILSYEVRFIFIIIILIILRERYSFFDFLKFQVNFWYLFILYPLFIIYFISILAELNRRPIDFIEGESELVSGFNIEYFSGGFTIIFLSEYGIIIFFRFVRVLLFTDLLLKVYVLFIFLNLIVICIIFMRGLLPRMRYDELIYLCWKVILPLILFYVLGIISFKFILILII